MTCNGPRQRPPQRLAANTNTNARTTSTETEQAYDVELKSAEVLSGGSGGGEPARAGTSAAWTLGVLSLCYVHNSVATFVLPAILPQVCI